MEGEPMSPITPVGWLYSLVGSPTEDFRAAERAARAELARDGAAAVARRMEKEIDHRWPWWRTATCDWSLSSGLPARAISRLAEWRETGCGEHLVLAVLALGDAQ